MKSRKGTWLSAVLFSLLLIACGGGGNAPEPPKFEISRLDVAIGSMDAGSWEEYTYIVGPVDGPIIVTSEETRRGHLRIFTHIYNELPIAFQHMTISYTGLADEVTEHIHPFDPNLSALTNEEIERWTTGWEIFVVYGELKAGEYTLCNWVEAPDGTLSNAECFDVVVVGDGDLPPEQLDIKRLY